MPFGLKNSTATFQRVMNKVIADLLGTGCYIDDIVVYSMPWESHLEYLRALFERLLELGLAASGSNSGHGCAYTVLQTVQRHGVYSADYGTVHYKEPLKSFKI